MNYFEVLGTVMNSQVVSIQKFDSHSVHVLPITCNSKK